MRLMNPHTSHPVRRREFQVHLNIYFINLEGFITNLYLKWYIINIIRICTYNFETLSPLISCSCPKFSCKICFYIFKIHLNGSPVESNRQQSIHWELHFFVQLVWGNRKKQHKDGREAQSLSFQWMQWNFFVFRHFKDVYPKKLLNRRSQYLCLALLE